MESVIQETIRENLDYRDENRQLKDKISRLEAEIAELKILFETYAESELFAASFKGADEMEGKV